MMCGVQCVCGGVSVWCVVSSVCGGGVSVWCVVSSVCVEELVYGVWCPVCGGGVSVWCVWRS